MRKARSEYEGVGYATFEMKGGNNVCPYILCLHKETLMHKKLIKGTSVRQGKR